jgi:hypothetical protein
MRSVSYQKKGDVYFSKNFLHNSDNVWELIKHTLYMKTESKYIVVTYYNQIWQNYNALE